MATLPKHAKQQHCISQINSLPLQNGHAQIDCKSVVRVKANPTLPTSMPHLGRLRGKICILRCNRLAEAHGRVQAPALDSPT